jgi:hypothetical protein
VWCDSGYDGGVKGRRNVLGVLMKRREVADVRTKDNLTIWSGMIKTPDHGQPLVEKVWEAIGQIGQVFTVSRHPPQYHEKHRIG